MVKAQGSLMVLQSTWGAERTQFSNWTTITTVKQRLQMIKNPPNPLFPFGPSQPSHQKSSWLRIHASAFHHVAVSSHTGGDPVWLWKREGPACIPENWRVESSTTLPATLAFSPPHLTLQTHPHLCAGCSLLGVFFPRPPSGSGPCFPQVASACETPLFNSSQVSFPTPVSPTTVPFYFPPKALSPHGSMIIVVLAKQDIYRGLGDKSCWESKVTVQDFLSFFLSAI